MAILGKIDPRAVHVKIVNIEGKLYFVSVMPPQEEVHDEMVWRFPKPNTLGFYQFQEYTGEAPTGIHDYALARADHFSEAYTTI